MNPDRAEATARVVFAAVVMVLLVSCSSRPPTDYSNATMAQCEALGDRWPYTVTAEESRCIDAVYHTHSMQAEQRQLEFEKTHADVKAILEKYNVAHPGAPIPESADPSDAIDDLMLCNGLHPDDAFQAWECYDSMPK